MRNTIFILLLLICTAFTQQYLLRDDFREAKTHWKWEAVGTAQKPEVQDGILFINLQDPIDGTECNTAIWDGRNIYRYARVKMRVKALTEMKVGSRGWGFWHTSGFPVDSLDIAWFMEQEDPQNSIQSTWWRAFTTSDSSPLTWRIQDLESGSNLKWHTYEIIWKPDEVEMFVDSTRIFYSAENIPDTRMAFHAWVDNQVYDLSQEPVPYGWNGSNAIAVDFVEISPPDYQSPPPYSDGAIILRDSASVIADGFSHPFKHYQFSTENYRYYFLLTAAAENNGGFDDPDALSIQIDNEHLGWDSPQAVAGAQLSGHIKTVFIDTVLSAGNHALKLFTRASPTLYDFTVLNGKYLELALYDEINAVAPGTRNSKWQTYDFYSPEGEVYIYLTGSAREDSLYSWDNPVLDEDRDDDLKIVLDDHDFGWDSATSINGNRLWGNGRTLLIRQTVNEGKHHLEIWSEHRPFLGSVYIFIPRISTAIGQTPDTEFQKPDLNVYPNPFNQSLNIELRSTISRELEIEIFDISGRLIRRFAGHNFNAGSHRLRWDGLDSLGNPASSGVFLIRVSNSKFSLVEKVLLLK